MTLIALVRHGQTDWNREGRVQGHSDIPLNDTGRVQAQAAAAALRGGEYTRLVASPLSRARETAEIIGRALGLGEPELFDGLKERNYGVAEGLEVEEFWRDYRGKPHIPGAETNDEVRERALATLRNVADEAGEEPVIVVAHGGLIGQVLRHLSDGSLPRDGEHIANGSQQVVAVDTDDMRVVAYNGTPR